jgi:hypothetical protein
MVLLHDVKLPKGIPFATKCQWHIRYGIIVFAPALCFSVLLPVVHSNANQGLIFRISFPVTSRERQPESGLVSVIIGVGNFGRNGNLTLSALP